MATFFISIFILALIELKINALFNWIPNVGCRKAKIYQQKAKMTVMDNDVIAEEQRVSMMTKNYRRKTDTAQIFDLNLIDKDR